MVLLNILLSSALCSGDGVEYSSDKKTLISTPTKLEFFTIPTNCEIINGGDSRIKSSFYNCIDNIKSIDCNTGCLLKCIYPYVFHHSSLESVNLKNCIQLPFINHSVFRECEKLTLVYLPDGITDIKSGSFYCCTSLKSIKIPDSVQKIWGHDEQHKAAFNGCKSLETFTLTSLSHLIELGTDNFIYSQVHSIYIPKSTTSIATGLFGGKVATIEKHPENLNFVVKDNLLLSADGKTILYACYMNNDEYIIPSYVERVEQSGFRFNAMKSIKAPTSITIFCSLSFDSCDEITSFEFPENANIQRVEWRTFSHCKKLKTVKLSSNIAVIGLEAFWDCPSLTTVNMEKITQIEDTAFRDCVSFTEFLCPAGLSNIGSGVFAGCCNLQFNLNGNTYFIMHDNVLYQSNVAKAYFGNGGSVEILPTCIGIGDFLFYKRKVKSVTINPSNSFYIGKGAFKETEIQTISLPAQTNSISDEAFMNCTFLTTAEISVQSTIASIPNSCFMLCSSLTGVTFPSCITSIGNDAFYECELLTTFDIEHSKVQTIGKNAFYHTQIQVLILPNTVNFIDENCFAESLVKTVNLGPTTLNKIVQGTFANCQELNSIIFADSINTISGLSFSTCTNLIEVLFPKNIVEISPRAFENCYNLIKISFKKDCTLDRISGQSFKGCKKLATVTVPEGDTMLYAEDGVLMNQEKTLLKLFLPGSPLTIFVVPVGIKTIGDYAFQDCSNLETIVIPDGNINKLGYHSFDGCTSLKTLWIPKEVKEFGIGAFVNCPNLKCGSVKFKGDQTAKLAAMEAGIPLEAFQTNCQKVVVSQCRCFSNFRFFFLFVMAII